MRLTEELRFNTTPTETPSGNAAGASWRPTPPGGTGRGSTGSSGFFDLLAPSELDSTFQLLIASIMALPVETAVATIGRYGRILTATEADIIASHQASGATPRETDTLIGQGGKRSKKEKKKRAKRGETLQNNPDLKDDIEDGTVSEEQLDDLAAADTKTDGAASQDEDLLEDIRNSNPDQSKDTIKDFVNNHNAADAETAHDRQRRLRTLSRFTTKDGLEAIKAEGDKAAIDTIWNLIRKEANDLYRKDGGRDLPPSKHPRSHTQRLFDAFTNHFQGSPGGSGSNKDNGRPAIVITARLDNNGELADPHLIGSGPLPQSVFDRYFCNSTIAGILFGSNGQALWHGKSHRTATKIQHTTLVARDKGCVLCKAHPQQCEAHHLLPWNAPGKGRTNIDNLALLCPDCHHMVHDTHQTVFQDTNGRWKLRAATVDEIAPKRIPAGPKPNRRSNE